MARFLYWSDLHTEFAQFKLPNVSNIDAVLLGGDTAVGDRHLDALFEMWETYNVPILSVRGNHEFYKQIWQDQIQRDTARLEAWHAEGIPIFVLDKDTKVIAGVRIIGATLWTDMCLMGDGGVHAAPHVERALTDYHLVSWRENNKVRSLRASDTRAEHDKDKSYIFQELAEPFEGKTLVMTHHIPTPLCIAPRYKNDIITAGFASDLTTLMLDSTADMWLYGHTHESNDTTLEAKNGPLKVKSNIRGYPQEWRTSTFDPEFVLEI